MRLKLYKYLKYEDGAKAVISHGTMKFSRYDEFNDPFDCVVSYDLEDSLEYIKSRKDLMKAVGDKLKLSPAKRISKQPILLKNLEKSIISGEFHRGLLEPIGISCFSLEPDNILMWSHYSDNHKGFVIEFDTFQDKYAELESVESKLIGYPVDYAKEMPKISARNGQDGFEAVQKVLLTKSDSWGYEKEFRILSTHKGPGIHEFDRNLISRVIVGAKMNDQDRVDLENRIHSLNSDYGLSIEIAAAQMSIERYEINIT